MSAATTTPRAPAPKRYGGRYETVVSKKGGKALTMSKPRIRKRKKR